MLLASTMNQVNRCIARCGKMTCCLLYMSLHAVLMCVRYGVLVSQDAEEQDAKEQAPPASAKGLYPAAGAAEAQQRVAVSGAVVESTQQALHWLRDRRMLSFEGGKWAPRVLGLATHASGLPPEEAPVIKEARHIMIPEESSSLLFMHFLWAPRALGPATHASGPPPEEVPIIKGAPHLAFEKGTKHLFPSVHVRPAARGHANCQRGIPQIGMWKDHQPLLT